MLKSEYDLNFVKRIINYHFLWKSCVQLETQKPKMEKIFCRSGALLINIANFTITSRNPNIS